MVWISHCDWVCSQGVGTPVLCTGHISMCVVWSEARLSWDKWMWTRSDPAEGPGVSGEAEIRAWPACFCSEGWQEGGHELPCTLLFPANVSARRYWHFYFLAMSWWWLMKAGGLPVGGFRQQRAVPHHPVPPNHPSPFHDNWSLKQTLQGWRQGSGIWPPNNYSNQNSITSPPLPSHMILLNPNS